MGFDQVYSITALQWSIKQYKICLTYIQYRKTANETGGKSHISYKGMFNEPFYSHHTSDTSLALNTFINEYYNDNDIYFVLMTCNVDIVEILKYMEYSSRAIIIAFIKVFDINSILYLVDWEIRPHAWLVTLIWFLMLAPGPHANHLSLVACVATIYCLVIQNITLYNNLFKRL